MIKQSDYRKFLQQFDANIDLILTDPPYAISRDTGFANVGKNSVKRFAVSMDFGEWDKQEICYKSLSNLSYAALRKGGTLIVFCDLWKITKLKESLENAGFKQLRLIEWIKTNPTPLNSNINYLTNAREVAISAVKVGCPTFNSKYDNGQYRYPICREKNANIGKRWHPTQKPIKLMTDLVLKHSNNGDLVVDPFLGSGSTAIAALKSNRKFLGCDISTDYVKAAQLRINML